MISYTEAKLDTLYQVTTELQDELKVATKHIKAAKSKEMTEKLKEIESQKRDKLQRCVK